MLERVTQRKAEVHLVETATAQSVLLQVAGIDEVADDAVCRPLRNPHALGEVAQPGVRFPGHAQQHVRVIRQKPPLRHRITLPASSLLV